MSRRVVVTGIGLVTPLGVGSKINWHNLINSKSGIISTKSLSDYVESGWDTIPSKVIGKVPSGSFSEGKWDSKDHFEKAEAKRLALFSQYALVATREALKDSCFTPDSETKYDTGVAIGSGIGSFHDTYENAVGFHNTRYRAVQPIFIPRLLTNMAAGNVSIAHGIKGPLHSVSTACATGLHAIGDAYNFINNGYAKVMIAGGTESSIHPLALAGFAKARSVLTSFNDEPEKASRPFDKERNGFVLGEGCGILILEDLDFAKKRGVKPNDIYGEIVGYGLTGDAHHITAPMEDGNGAFRAMKMALDRAGVDPEQVDYVNAHATSTVIGDRSENKAINDLFKHNELLNISSNKSSIGHLLGAAGAVESIFTLKSLKHNIIPPTLNLNNIGGSKGDEGKQFERFDYVPNVAKEQVINIAVCNSFGFGGVNSSICFKKYV